MNAFETQLEPHVVFHTLDVNEPRRFVYLEVIKRIVQNIGQFDSLHPLLDYVVIALREQLDFYIASVFWYDEEGAEAVLLAQDGQSHLPAPLGYTQPITSGLLGRTLRESRSFIVDDVSQAFDYVSPQGYAPAGSELCVPIFCNGVLWGAFNVESIASCAFTYYDKLALELIATKLGSAIHTMDLYTQQKQTLVVLSEKTEQQQQLIDQIMELSTPVFPVHPGILALPLVGQLDEIRMERTVTSLLETIQQTSSHSVIVDVTGAALYDEGAAQMLVRLTHMCKLLGAQVILTGIRPEAAQMFVGLQVDLGDITVQSTFAAGLRYALHASGVRLVTGG